MTAVVRRLVELHCDSPTGCPEVWVGGTDQPDDDVRADAVAAGWQWADDEWTRDHGALHWCPGPHLGTAR